MAAQPGSAQPKPSKSRRDDRPEFAAIREQLVERLTELQREYDQAAADLDDLQRDRVIASAGDDPADTGTKTFEREQEVSLLTGVRQRIAQTEQALAKLDDGTYGLCERCGNEIPTARLEAFPSVTLCMTCKQREERR
jgi:DnaK suppressor protein